MRRGAAAAVLAASFLVSGCTPTPGPTQPPTLPSPTAHRAFTVATTDRVTTTDPAAAVLPADQMLAYNLFQRLMAVEPATGKLVPDAAQDCLFASATVYECRLREDLTFHNGHPVTSDDVRFSVLRALRLDVDGSQTAALSSLTTVEAPSPAVVRFQLRWPDTQFGYALTSPATSIVDRSVYDPDQQAPADAPVIGSGPYAASTVTQDMRLFTRWQEYRGLSAAQVDRIVLRSYPDSAALEDAMAEGQVDVVWRGLSEAARRRLGDQASARPDHATDAGYTATVSPRAVLWVIRWDARSRNRIDGRLRAAVAGALQEERTLDSLLLPGSTGHSASFPLGGRPTGTPTAGPSRVTLTMGYNPRVADDADLARRLRDRLEAGAGLSVRLVPDPAAADLHLDSSSAWIAQPVGELLAYLSAPLPGSAAKLAALDERYRSVTDPAQRDVALTEIQQQAAADLTVVPIAADDQTVYLADGVKLSEPTLAGGNQPLFSVMHR